MVCHCHRMLVVVAAQQLWRRRLRRRRRLRWSRHHHPQQVELLVPGVLSELFVAVALFLFLFLPLPLPLLLALLYLEAWRMQLPPSRCQRPPAPLLQQPELWQPPLLLVPLAVLATLPSRLETGSFLQ